MYTYLLIIPKGNAGIDPSDFNKIISRIAELDQRPINDDFVIIFTEEKPEDLANKLFAGLQPNPNVNLVLISDTTFSPK